MYYYFINYDVCEFFILCCFNWVMILSEIVYFFLFFSPDLMVLGILVP